MDKQNTINDMKKLECPINWDLETMNVGNAAKKLLSRSETRNEGSDASSCWQAIAVDLCLASLDYLSADKDNKMNEHLKHANQLCEEHKECYPLIREYSKCVKYILKAMWIYYYHKRGLTEDVEKNLKQIPAFEALPPKEKAGILAMKATCFMAFGPQGTYTTLRSLLKQN